MRKLTRMLALSLSVAAVVSCSNEEISVDSLPGYVRNGTTITLDGKPVQVYGNDTCSNQSGCVIFYGRRDVPVIVEARDAVNKEVWEVELAEHGRMRVISRKIIHRDGLVEKQ